MIDSKTAKTYIARTANLVAAARIRKLYCCFKNRQTGIGHHKSDLGTCSPFAKDFKITIPKIILVGTAEGT